MTGNHLGSVFTVNFLAKCLVFFFSIILLVFFFFSYCLLFLKYHHSGLKIEMRKHFEMLKSASQRRPLTMPPVSWRFRAFDS